MEAANNAQDNTPIVWGVGCTDLVPVTSIIDQHHTEQGYFVTPERNIMQQRRYFIARNAVCAISPLAELEVYCSFLEQHNNWDEVTFKRWWPIHWECTDFTDPCPLCPTEERYWKSLE